MTALQQQEGFAGLRVVAFESRRAREMAELIRNKSGVPVTAPAMREVTIGENAAALDFLRRLEAKQIDVVILLTGVGTRTLVATLAPVCMPERFADLLRGVTVVARGPKPVAALRELGLAPDITAPEPNTWRELLAALDEQCALRGKTVAVQEYGAENPELIAGLEERGAGVWRVPVYRWALPEDLEPLREAVAALAGGAIDVALFTSATQVEHLVRIATDMGMLEGVKRGAARTVFGSIGPVCSEALRRHGLPVDFEPEHGKMGHLVATAARSAASLLRAKRRD